MLEVRLSSCTALVGAPSFSRPSPRQPLRPSPLSAAQATVSRGRSPRRKASRRRSTSNPRQRGLAWYQARIPEARSRRAAGNASPLRFERDDADDRAERRAGRPESADRRARGGPHRRFRRHQRPFRRRQGRRARFRRPERAFVDFVIAEGIEPKENFPAGPYPADKLTYKSPTLVEFATPAGKDGLGAADGLAKFRCRSSNSPSSSARRTAPISICSPSAFPPPRPIWRRRSSPRPRRPCPVRRHERDVCAAAWRA